MLSEGTIPSHPPHKNWESFQGYLGTFSKKERRKINFAYQLAKAAHRGIERESGERYFEHLRGSALILLSEVRPQEPAAATPNRIIEALLHDGPEDTALFGNPVKTPYAVWQSEVLENITSVFGREVAENILTVTKPYVDEVEILDKAEALDRYYDQLRQGSEEALLIKMADRLHNLRTLWATSDQKQRRKIKETREVLFPIFERARTTYPQATAYLLEQMTSQIATLQQIANL